MALTRRPGEALTFVRCFWQSRVARFSRQQNLTAFSFGKSGRLASALALLNELGMSAVVQTSVCEITSQKVAQTSVCELPAKKSQTEVCATFLHGLRRRFARERRRRKVGRAYDMALEIARVLPRHSEVLDVGCGNGYIAHHLSAMLGTRVVGIDLMEGTEAPIEYRRYHGTHFPARDNSVDAVLLCYVLHHAQDVAAVMKEVRRVLREGGLAIIYEDIPQSWWDKGVCWVHNRQWKDRTGPCTFRDESVWPELFGSFGFRIVSNRQLSRWRNLTHPVQRVTYLLRSQPILAGASEAGRHSTRPGNQPDARAPRRSNCRYRRYTPSSAVESQPADRLLAWPPIP